jgi:membrane dipeptidase
LKRYKHCQRLYLAALVLAFAGTASFAQRNLHFRYPLVDGHNDVLSNATMAGLNIEQNLRGKTHSDLARFWQGGVDVQFFSIFTDGGIGKGKAFATAIKQIDSLDAITSRNPDKMVPVTNPAVIYKLHKTGKLGVAKGVEGGHMIEDDIALLDSLFNRGVRYLTLAHNVSPSWVTSAFTEKAIMDSAARGLNPVRKPGLSNFGRQVVRRMNELGMLVDLSHVGPQAIADVLEVSNRPPLVSHSSCAAICPATRNLTDAQLKAIAQKGGVVCINFYSGFIDNMYDKRRAALLAKYKAEKDSLVMAGTDDYSVEQYILANHKEDAEKLRPSFEMLIDHIDHVVKVAGINHVGLGSDFDGVTSLPAGINGVEDYPKITVALVKRGYSKNQIAKILGGNVIRVWKQNYVKR